MQELEETSKIILILFEKIPKNGTFMASSRI